MGLKAYEVSCDGSDFPHSEICWAMTPGQAKARFTNSEEMEYPEFIDLQCKRAEWADDFQNLPAGDFLIEELKRGYGYYLVSPLPDGDEWLSKDDVAFIKWAGGMDNVCHYFEDHGELTPLRKAYQRTNTNA